MDSDLTTSKLAELQKIAAAVSDQVNTVALLYGGTSGEREVSISSGKDVREILEEEGFSVSFIDTGKPGFVEDLLACRPDVAFIALHGEGGEDGCIQGFLETLGIPYTHSGVEASAIAMDKRASKIFYRDFGLDTAEYLEIKKEEPPNEVEIDTLVAGIGLPCVVKPVFGGSSLGVMIPKDRDALVSAISACFDVDDDLLVEEFIRGIEVTVPVVGNDPAELFALPVIEIVPKNEFYDYESKYAEGGSEHIIPARISEREAELCQQAAIDAHIALGCAGVSRTDMIVTAQGMVSIIETNTVPGMTRTSLIPEDAQRFGLTKGEIYRLLLHYALKRT